MTDEPADAFMAVKTVAARDVAGVQVKQEKGNVAAGA
jgi:hypothetical protein